MATLQEERLLRLHQIVGDPRRGIEPLIPVSRATWWSGVKSGRFPKPVKLGPGTTCWRWSDLAKLLEAGA